MSNELFFMNSDIQKTYVAEGVDRKVVATGGTMMCVEVLFKIKGGVGATHKHHHEQISYCVRGSFEYTIEGVTKVLKPGDSSYVPTNAMHGAISLEADSILLDIFTPQREDFK